MAPYIESADKLLIRPTLLSGVDNAMAECAAIIRENLSAIWQNVTAACERVGREPDSVTLVAVTKTVGVEEMRAIREAGWRHIGENRVQNALKKAELLLDFDVTWHMIGHLQRNKAREALQLFHLIHSVDNIRLAQELERRAQDLDCAARILVQVNTSAEESKFGIEPSALIPLLREISSMSHVHVEGLMTMAPLMGNAENVRPYFRKLRELLDNARQVEAPNIDLRHLSMGMTQDYVVAVEEGATLIRVGSAIFQGLT